MLTAPLPGPAPCAGGGPDAVSNTTLPLDAAELRRRIGHTNQHKPAVASRDERTRILMRTDAELIALAVACNRGLRDGMTVAQITAAVERVAGQRRIDDNVTRAFLRAVRLDHLVKRNGTFASYHARMQALSVELGRSAYTHKRGPARSHIELLDEDEEQVDVNDYIRGQGGF